MSSPDHTHALSSDAFVAETRRATRGSGLLLGALAIFAVGAWSGMDVILQPANADLFIALRAVCIVAMAVICVLLRTPLGERSPEALVLALTALPQLAVAVMVSRLDGGYAPYATGFSLAIYGSAFLLIWRWTYTLALIALTWLALAIALSLSPDPPGLAEISTVAFYLATASALSLAGQWYRTRLAHQALRSRAELVREQARNHELLARLERLSHEDELTGLANRRSWEQALGRAFAHARRSHRSLAVLLCDLDYFKQVNDSHGHQAGDHVLRETAALLAARTRAGDLVARLGGDEFAVLCPDADLAVAMALADALITQASELPSPSGNGAAISISIGAATLEAGDHTPDALVARADSHLYQAKRCRGRACGAHPAPIAV